MEPARVLANGEKIRMKTTILIQGDREKARVMRLIDELSTVPVHEVVIREYVPETNRSAAQNRLAFKWYEEAANQLKDGSKQEKRAYCKLHIGVGILKAGTSKICEQFRAQYDLVIKPLSYEDKLRAMVPPFDLPVTSLMTVKQFSEYLDEVWHHFTRLGVSLTQPPDIYELAMGIKR